MNQNQQATLNQAIKLLQSLLIGGKNQQQTAPVDIAIPEFDTQIANFYSKGSTLQPEIQKLTQLFKKAAQAMKSIMGYSQFCKKYSAAQEQKLKNIFINLSNEVQTIMKKNGQFMDHCKALKEIISATFWVFVPTPEFIIKGAVQGADFNALKFQKKKNQEHNQWWAFLSGACKSLQKFIVKQYPTGLNFKYNGQDKWDQIISGSSNIASNTQQSQKQQQPSQSQQHSTTTTTAKVSQQANKPPKKQLIGLNWQIRNYQKQNIVLSNEVQMKHGIFIQNTNSSQIKIESKFKSLNLNKCNDITLFIKSCISGIQLMNCKNVIVIVKQKTPSISVDKSQRVKLVLNENNLDTDIVSCKASQLNVLIERNNGEESKAHLISDQLITKWNPQTKKFQTAVYDKFL